MKIQEFIKRGEPNPDGLPESSNIVKIEFYPEQLENGKNSAYPLMVEFDGGKRYEYKVQRVKGIDFDMMWKALTEGWHDGRRKLIPGQVFHRYVKFKCPYREVEKL